MFGPLTIAIVVGEASGDQLGASLMRAIQERAPDTRFVGIGGAGMLAQGFDSLVPMDRLSVMGLFEPLKRLPELFSIKNRLLEFFSANRPDVFIGIDAPDFNLRVEQPLKELGVPTVHYVSPSVWAWRQGRIKTIRRAADLVLCLLPFEVDFYRNHSMNAVFVGHPMADEIDWRPPREVVAVSEPCIAVLPGSRKSEVEQMVPIFLATALRLKARYPNARFLLPAANSMLADRIRLLDTEGLFEITEGQVRKILSQADVALVASGTATLETMLTQCPMVVAYKVDWLTYLVGKCLVKVRWLSLVNLLANRELVVERIQFESETNRLTADIESLLQDLPRQQAMIATFSDMHRDLQKNASASAAEAVLQLIGRKEPVS